MMAVIGQLLIGVELYVKLKILQLMVITNTY